MSNAKTQFIKDRDSCEKPLRNEKKADTNMKNSIKKSKIK